MLNFFKKTAPDRDIYNYLPFASCIITKDLKVESSNLKFLRFFNISEISEKENLYEKLTLQIPRLEDFIREGLSGKPFEATLSNSAEVQPKVSWYRIIGSPIKDKDDNLVEKLFLTIEDITGRKETDFKSLQDSGKRTEELIEEKARFQASIDNINVGFIITDTKGEIMVINTPAKNILCTPKPLTKLDEHAKFALSTLQCSMKDIHTQLKPVFDLPSQIQNCLNSGRAFDIVELPFKNLILHISINPIAILKEKEKLGIEFIGSVILIEDVTEEKILEHSREDFFSIASHELRTPLTAIKGNTEIIEKYFAGVIKEPMLRRIIEDIHESSVRLITMVNDFLDLSRFEQGKVKFNLEVFEPSSLISRVLEELRPIAMEKGLYLKFSTPLKKPLIKADEDKVNQVLINLVGNAIKFTSKGGVTVSMRVFGKYLKVLVADTGSGISPQNQNLIFRKFQLAQENILTRDTSRSTGVGLYISKLMVEGMKGEIKIEETKEGKGSTFSFTLPIVSS